jgi:glycosyltransferase involved in cell wall biosynthesis
MTAMADKETFDGIICLGGEDWWYHNRGHFDFQIMRRLAQKWPVLFVNSLGVRMPDLGDKKLFAERIGRKLKSLKRGVVHVENQFWVFSPAVLPGARGAMLTNWALSPQIRMAARRAGIKRPLLWVHCPAGAAMMTKIPNAAIVMQRTDRFEAFPEGDPALLTKQIKSIKAVADLTVYAAPHLMQEESGQVKRQVLVTHGVDLERFVSAGLGGAPEPDDLRGVRRPRVGFIGGIDAHTFDPDLFLGTAARLPHAEFVMIGGSSLPKDWCTLPNVRFLGRKPYDEIADYMAAMDVLIMPWNGSDWIKACNPVKLKEYLAVGRPVVTRDFAALDGFRDLVRTAGDSESFAREIRLALNEPYNADEARRRVATETWDAKALILQDAIAGLGLVFESAVATADSVPVGEAVSAT